MNKDKLIKEEMKELDEFILHDRGCDTIGSKWKCNCSKQAYLKKIESSLSKMYEEAVNQSIAVCVNNSTPSNEQMKIVRELRSLLKSKY